MYRTPLLPATLLPPLSSDGPRASRPSTSDPLCPVWAGHRGPPARAVRVAPGTPQRSDIAWSVVLVLLPPSETKSPGGDGGPLDLARLVLRSLKQVGKAASPGSRR